MTAQNDKGIDEIFHTSYPHTSAIHKKVKWYEVNQTFPACVSQKHVMFETFIRKTKSCCWRKHKQRKSIHADLSKIHETSEEVDLMLRSKPIWLWFQVACLTSCMAWNPLEIMFKIIMIHFAIKKNDIIKLLSGANNKQGKRTGLLFRKLPGSKKQI